MSTTALQVKDLTKNFGKLIAVDNLSFEINHGEVFGFLGPNGAGKSTSINMICGLLKPTSGQIFIEDKEVKATSSIRTKIGICPQNIIIWPKLTCFEQLVFIGQTYSMSRAAAKERALFFLKEMGLFEKRNKLAQTLSGGMQRRLNLILGLIHDPEILILDEPEAGLDPQSRILVREFIKSLAKEKTIILTTHNMDEADRVADRVAIIDHGKLLKLDTPTSLKKSIGEGDILEIIFSEKLKDEKLIISLLKPLCESINVSQSSILIKSKNIVERIPDIISNLKNNGVHILEIKLRENSLEDVFIHLTGRNLRT
jgi:ABC-2 type transport system ATP-binding protein